MKKSPRSCLVRRFACLLIQSGLAAAGGSLSDRKSSFSCFIMQNSFNAHPSVIGCESLKPYILCKGRIGGCGGVVLWGRPSKRGSKTHFFHSQCAVLPPFDEVQPRLSARYLTLTAARVITLHSSRAFVQTCTISTCQTIEIAGTVAARIRFVVATAAISQSV